MATKSKKGPSFEEENQALSELRDFASEAARERLREALASRRGLIVARAARLAKDRRVAGLEAELAAAFDRFLGESPKADPTGAAKLAAIEALDYAETLDPTPFLRASAHQQWQGGSDVAAPLRARAVVALARLGHPDFDLVAARLLTDVTASVRQAALEALVHRGDRAHAALALVKVRGGDEDPSVTVAAMNALVTLAPAWGIAELREILAGGAGDRIELAAVALGGSRSDEALTALVDALAACTQSAGREPLLRGIGLHRSDRALEELLAVIAERSDDDARTAIAALAPRRFEPGLAARVRTAAAANDRAAPLDAAVDDVFGPPADASR